ncbi:DUF748 domain-containing protein [Paraglaciecola arctica]|uniref:DUF748 domain-containing protein n=1 Tax=Paraglaciecola arctica BSs20135 TaxID=493475 RepID=K6YT34_9ALTE|nr:DUF748 domain-containing protein [Paraglaciecola arctica]GAC21302.1 hypothetical protein GARC_4360 [Paraglaciecola arctica BSs20135]
MFDQNTQQKAVKKTALGISNNSFGKLSVVTLLTVLVVFIALRLTAPTIITWYANRAIERTPAIVGSVDDVDLALIAGNYSIKGVNIRQLGDKETFPLFIADRVNVSILWSELFWGELVTEITVIKPTIGLYDRPDDKVFEDSAITDEKTWIGLVRDLTPFAIDKLTVENGTFIMDAQAQLKRSEFSVQNIQLIVTNIANASVTDTVAIAKMTGDIQNQAQLKLSANFDPNTNKPTFDINIEMERLPVSYIDSLMKFYAPFDLEAGQIELASELKSVNGKVTGDVQAGIYKLDVFSWHEDVVEDGDNPIQLIFDMIGGALASLLESGDKYLIATRVSIEGSLDDPDVSTFDALLGILKNAFIEAYSLKVEDSVSGLEEPLSDNKESPKAKAEVES